MQVTEQIDGIMIGVIQGIENGVPLVAYPANPLDHPVAARSLVALDADHVGCEVALQFERGQVDRPLILGRIIEPDEGTEVLRDGDHVRVTGKERIELRCGKASIIMEADGHITIRGSYLVNHATASNRIRGGSVNIN
ncbi:DUF6484 domain-containing protein [uncultured Ruegeria sp.]|uniref:DUF6484 domain-containing protein n=1 Tax=uncultured Ruegeria sp. TaxID=259304 RepID=UPI00260EDF07|nr:DUF6484 domain-containing protein [uncultured Ruegeria sp.]